MIKSADISPCGLYRYRLSRIWNVDLPVLVFICLNPSTADAELDDPTLRRCIGFAMRDGFGGVMVINLFAFRATKPEDMRAAPDPVGPLNDAHLLMAINNRADGSRFVAAWGVHGRLRDRDLEVANAFRTLGVTLWCLGHTKDGDPRHPLYIRGDQAFVALHREEEIALLKEAA